MEVLDEPLYANFLRATGVDRPYRQELLSKMVRFGTMLGSTLTDSLNCLELWLVSTSEVVGRQATNLVPTFKLSGCNAAFNILFLVSNRCLCL
jgi:aminoglycoside N3'-acetyltransferase